MSETIFFAACAVGFFVDGWLYWLYAEATAPLRVRRLCGAALLGLLALQVGAVAWAALGLPSS